MGQNTEHRTQNSEVSDTPLASAYDAISLFSGATESQRVVMALWAAHTYVYEYFGATPRLSFCADEPATGKTVNMQVTVALSRNPLVLGYTSQASVYSWLDEHPDTTFGLDEIDKAFGTTGRKTSRSILAAVVNDGYTPKGRIMVNRNGHAAQMPVFCPIATAGLGSLPADTLTRAIVMHMHKSVPGEVYIPEIHDDGLAFIGTELRDWLTSKQSIEFLKAQPMLADTVKGDPRFRLITAPLAAIARLAGMEDRFLSAVEEIQTGIVSTPPTPTHVLLLRDLRESWPHDGPRIAPASQLITWLAAHDSGRWARLETGRVGEIALAGMLRQDGIETRTSNGTRGYRESDVYGVTQ